jgi:type II secretory ATPase GspE/PulE/Tfp pilus assembly ATPase PilB-like protein
MGLQMLASTLTPTGGYINGLLVIPVVLLVLAWAKALTWVDKDAEAARLPRDLINSGLMGGLILALVAFFILPNFFLAFAAMLVVVGIEAGVYLSMRKNKVGLSDIKGDFKNWISNIGREQKPVAEISGAVQMVGPNGALLPAPKVNTPEAESYQGIQTMLTDPLVNNAEVIDIAPGENGLSVKYMVDGVFYNGATVQRAVGTAALAYLKAAAGLDIGEVRKPQKGTLKLNVNSKRKEMQLDTKGSTAGEYARFTADARKRHDFTPATLGFNAEQLDLIKKTIVQGGGGVTLVTTPRGQGLTSLSYAMLRGHDAFLQNIRTIERDAEQDLEGITQDKLPRSATPEEEAKLSGWIISQQPDVVLLAKPESPQSVIEFIKVAKEGKHVYFSFNANSTIEALWIFCKLVGDNKLAVSQLQMIINGRVLRKLCSACKQGYTPDPETLRKLNMDASKVDTLYQARKEPIRDPKGNPIKCEFCNDLRYKGRTGMFEMLLVDEHIKQVATNGMTPEQNAGPIKTAFRKQRGKYLQEVGLGLVEAGETSVQEVLRVLKAGSEAPSTGGAPPAGGAAKSAPRKPKGPVPTA